MPALNRVTLIGNLGGDATLRYTNNGQAVSNLSLATTDKWRDAGGDLKEHTEWHRVTLWGKTAESLNEYLTKGRQIYVEGRLQTREWEDKDGNKQRTTDIVARQVLLLGSRPGTPETRAESGESPPPDDIPI